MDRARDTGAKIDALVRGADWAPTGTRRHHRWIVDATENGNRVSSSGFLVGTPAFKPLPLAFSGRRRGASPEMTVHPARLRRGSCRRGASVIALDAMTRPRKRESGRPDSNRGPPAPKAGALPGCATSRRAKFTLPAPERLSAVERASAGALLLPRSALTVGSHVSP